MADSTLSNKMATKPIGKLLLSMSVPAMFSMLVMSLYNVVDSLFVSKVSQDALNALSLAFPMQSVAIAFALGIGVGTSTLVARRLGEGNRASAQTYAQTGLMLAIVFGLIFIIIGATTSQPFMAAFSDNDNVVKLGTQYLTICITCTIFVTIEMTINRIMQGTGNMIIPMISQLIGALVNIALDPILIFTAKLGVMGAGLATITGQLCSLVFMIIMAMRRKHIINVFFTKYFRPKLKHMSAIVRIGAPAMVVNAVAGFVTMLMNSILSGYSPDAVTVLGVYFKIQSFVFMPVFGLCQGALPIMSYNFGANQKGRFNKTLILSTIVSMTIMVAGVLLFQLGPELLLGLFSVNEETMAMGVTAFRAISWVFIPAAIGIIVSNAFQAVGYGISALVMTLLRQVALTLPFAILFGKLWGLDAIWYAYPVSELIPMLIFSIILFFVLKRAFSKRTDHYASIKSEQNNIGGETVISGQDFTDAEAIDVALIAEAQDDKDGTQE